MTMTQQTTTFLSAVYAAEKIPLTDAELARFAGRYPLARAAADSMFELAEAKYESPATVFSALARNPGGPQ
jgi:hypothetical protein